MFRLVRRIAMAFVIILSICASVWPQTATVRVVYYPPWNISKLPMYLARQLGMFERSGLELVWRDPGSNERSVAALKKGDADIAVVSANQAFVSMPRGGPPM